jgi:hypothetical protein
MMRISKKNRKLLDPRQINVQIPCDIPYSGKPSEFIAAFQAVLAKHGDNIDISINSTGYDEAVIETTGTREETPEEVNDRIDSWSAAQERATEAAAEATAKSARRVAYVKLRQEFG